ncbi:MAG: ChbG/HpnK family deacetylase, partial [Oscillospiraceae bacterium]|nr:ChbG/HpnK family deacetylase [Oscillospiraceae bacterium]
GIATGRLELLNQILDLSAETGLPFRFPLLGLAGQQDNQTLDIAVPRETLDMIFKQVQVYAKSRGVIAPDYLIPHDYNGPQKESYEQFRDYLYSLIETFPAGVTETYLHPSVDTGEIRAASSVGSRRMWEYEVYRDPRTKQHFKDCGIQIISYADLAKMRK